MIQQPYLIQRGMIAHPLVKGRLGEAVSMDYMGSSEFEFGALPQSLRALQRVQDKLTRVTETRIKSGEQSLRVLHALSPADYTEYFGYLLEMRADRLRTKEVTRFAAGYEQTRPHGTDFWWDVDNHVMFSFDKTFMNRLEDCLAASWKFMDEQKANK